MTPPAGPPAMRLFLFGDLEIQRGEDSIRLPTRKTELLLAYLALFPQPHGREALAALFWGDVTDEQARGSLRKALTALRRALGPDAILADRQTIGLNPDFALWVDAVEFNRLDVRRPVVPDNALAPGSAQPAALDLYRGDLLGEFYDDWIMPLREHFRTAYLERRLALAQEYRTRSEYGRAIEQAQHVLAVEPANERAHQHLMFAYLALGRRGEALRQYELARRALQEELAVTPSAETTALYRWVREGPGATPAAEARLTNLPIPLSSFIGREAETAQVKRLLRPANDPGTAPAARLITLTGPGGSGKTRLAIQAATDLIDDFPDGVWWVELAPLSDGSHVPRAVAQTLGAPESPDEPLLTTLVAFLTPRRVLLVLDNCEHLVAACAELAGGLLARCLHLRIIATSREPLGLSGEHALPVPPLDVPRYARWLLSDSLLNFEGVRLFVQRAQAIDPDFALTPENSAAVAQLCARLDGIPLAIELAAQWMRSLSAVELTERLDERFDLLTSGDRAAPARHRTLRNVLDWSYNLLAAPEQRLLRRLSVFAGGWFAEAVNWIAEDEPTGSPVVRRPTPDLLALLHRLVDKSLVTVTTASGRARYGMLETIREYARDKLAATDEVERMRAQHTRLFVDLALEAARGLRGPEQRSWLERLDDELDNIRAALTWTLAHDQAAGLRLAGVLVWYWNLRGHWHEGPAWLARLLVAGQGAPDAARAGGLVAAGHLAFWGSNDFAAARARLEEAIALYRRSEDVTFELADALALYGELLIEVGEPDPARTALMESLQLAEGLGENGRWVCAWAWLSMGGLPDPPPVKRERMERSAALFRAVGDEAQLPVALARLAWFHLWHEEYAAAESCAQESLLLTERIGDAMGAAWLLKLHGDLAHKQGDNDRAEAIYRAAYERFQTLGGQYGMADALSSLGEVAHAGGDAPRTRALWSEALALYVQIGHKEAVRDLSEQLAQLPD